MSRGKKRMGYELELKVKLKGLLGTRWEGLECSVELEELCDDGSAPESKLFITKEGSQSGTKFR
jgi:hypothetical protein